MINQQLLLKLLVLITIFSSCKNRTELPQSHAKYSFDGMENPTPSSSPIPNGTESPSPGSTSPSPSPSATPIDPSTFDDYDDYYEINETSSDPEPPPPGGVEPAPAPRPGVPVFNDLKLCDLKGFLFEVKDAQITSTRGTLGTLDVIVKISGKPNAGNYMFSFDVISKNPISTLPRFLPIPLSSVPTHQSVIARVNVTYIFKTNTLYISASASALNGYHISQLINKIIVRDMLGGNLPKNIYIEMIGTNREVYTYYRENQGLSHLEALKKVPSLAGLIADDAVVTVRTNTEVISGKINNPSAGDPPCENTCKVGPPKANNTEPFVATKDGSVTIYTKNGIITVQEVQDIKLGKAKVVLKATSVVGAGLALGPLLVYGQWGIGKVTTPEIGGLAGAATGLGISTLLIGKKLTLVTAAGSALGDQIAKFVEAESKDWRPGKAAGVVCAASTGAIFGPGGALLSAGAYVLADIAKESLPILEEYLKSKELDEFINSTEYEIKTIAYMIQNMAPSRATREELLPWITQLRNGPRDANGKLDYNVVAASIARSDKASLLLDLISRELFELGATSTENPDWLRTLQDYLLKNRSIVDTAMRLTDLRRASVALLGTLPTIAQAQAAIATTQGFWDHINQTQYRRDVVAKFVQDFWSEFLGDHNPPSTTVVNQWVTKAVDEKLSLSALFEAMTATELGRTAAINRIFMDLIGRMPNSDEMQEMLGNSNLTGPDSIFSYIKELPEHADNINSLFKMVLGRPATSAEINEAKGIGLGALLMTLISSDERSFMDLFVDCHCRMPNAQELEPMLNLLPASRNPLRAAAICGEVGPITATARSVFLDTYPQCKVGTAPLAPPPRIVSPTKKMPSDQDSCGQLNGGASSVACAPSTGLLPCVANGFSTLATLNGEVVERCFEAVDCERDVMDAKSVRAYSCGTLDSFDTLRQCSLQLVTTANMSVRVANRLSIYQRQQPRWVWTPYAQCLGTSKCYSSNGSIVYCQTNNVAAPECSNPMQASCTKSFRP